MNLDPYTGDTVRQPVDDVDRATPAAKRSCLLDISPIVERLRTRYGDPERHAPQEPIDELIQTILSQHTSDANTAKAFASLKRRFPSWEQVIEAPVEEVADAIQSGGLANQKAPRIQRALRDIRARTGGFDLHSLADMSVSDARNWLTSLHGVGPKTASCVLLFSLGRDVMPVDTHVHRVALRLGLIPAGTSAERAHCLLEQLIAPDAMYDTHLLMIRHGRETCTARRPRCEDCVLGDCCPSRTLFLRSG